MGRNKHIEKKIKRYWGERATDGGVSAAQVTHRDIWQRWLEIELIKRYLKKKQRILDVGCGNGYTIKQVNKLVKQVVGIDYSEEMINRAREENNSLLKREKAVFDVKDVLELTAEDYGKFDLVISERCLINLKSWKDQRKSIRNISTVIKRGGIFLFVEASSDGRQSLNRMRVNLGLPRMPKVWHNLDFRKDKMFPYLRRYFTIKEKLHFGVYDFLARVVHPLLVFPDEPKYEAFINKIAARFALDYQEFSEISRMHFLVLKKK